MSDNSIADQSDSMEARSTDGVQPASNLPAEQSETKTASVSEAALQDGERKPGTPKTVPALSFVTFLTTLRFCPVEMLRQLILRDLEEEGWSHDSDDTPTNEAAGQRSPLSEQQPSSGTVLNIAEEHEPEDDVRHQDDEQPRFQVVRKGRNEPFLIKAPNLKASAKKKITA